MPRPVFFSVGGASDTKFAASVKELLPDAMVYLYTRTGEEGVAFKPEIERELQSCRLFVVFWSDDYLKSDAAKIELAQVRRMAETTDQAKQVLVVPVKRKGPSIQSKWTNPLNAALRNEFVLGKWRLDRALDGAPDPKKVAEFVRRKLEDADVFGRILVPRPFILDLVRGSVMNQEFRASEFVFVSGLEGDGRRTVLRQFMKASYANLTERLVSFDSAEGPEDLLLRMLSSAGATAIHRDEVMSGVSAGSSTALKEIRKVVHQARTVKSYYVLAMDRFSGADTVAVPYWVSEVFNHFSFGNSPLIFLVTSSPVTDALLTHYPNAKRVRVPGLDEREMAELVHRLSNEDTKIIDWTTERRRLVQAISGSSPSLCQTIMLTLRNEQSLDFLETISNREEERFAANMSAVLGHIVQQFKENPNDVLALRVIKRLGLTSKKALDEVMAPLMREGSYNLYRMLEYGLVERLSDDVLRIPPLIERRLGYILGGATDNAELDTLFNTFGKRMLVGTDDYGAVYATNKATTGLVSGGEEDPRLAHYLTTATLFKIGLEQYSNHDYVKAHAILLRAMEKLTQQNSVDLSAQVEIARYFGLAAARVAAKSDVDRACDFLEVRMAGSPRAKQGKAMASFLRGFEARQRGNYAEAIREFEQAKHQLGSERSAERQRGAVLTELSRAYLRKSPPDYAKAVAAAQQAYEEKGVAHTLSGLIRARLHRTLSTAYSASTIYSAEVLAIRRLIADLTLICTKTDRDFNLFREAELEVMLAIRKRRERSVKLDLSKAITFIDQAFKVRPLLRTRSFGWKLRLFDECCNHTSLLLAEVRSVLDNQTNFRPQHVADAAKVFVMIMSRTDKQAANSVFYRYKDLLGQWSLGYLNRVIDAGGTVKDSDTFSAIDRL